MPTPLVIDTCAFLDKDFVFWLQKYHGWKILPAVAYTEVLYGLMNRGKSPEYLAKVLRSAGVDIEPFSPDLAVRAVYLAEGGNNFKKNARDYMIAAHAYTAPRIVVTNNLDDFSCLRDRVMNPRQVMKTF